MMRGAKILLATGGLAAAGCAATHDVSVRAVRDPAAKFRFGGDLLGQGRGQLALGNPGLALETFRRLQREQPQSAEAFAGIAACYAAMGRNDLARANYEFALAYAPTDRGLLSALASSLERLGDTELAENIRTEIARTSTAPIVGAPAEHRAVAPMGVPRASSLTVKLPALSDSSPKTQSRVNAQAPKPQLATATTVPLATRSIVLEQTALDPGVALSNPARDELPPALPPASEQRQMPAEKPRPMVVRQAETGRIAGPYLARNSLGEVSLITGPGPVWRAQPRATIPLRIEAHPALVQTAPRLAQASSTNSAATLRWLPLEYSPGRANIQLLNAARSQNLAARSRAALLDRGWRKIRIGNARKIRQRSIVLYSPAGAAIARRLAAHFRCKAVKVKGMESIVVLLGRDAALPRRLSSRV